MKRSMYHGLLFCMACCALSFANPVQVPKLPPLSEIYLISENSWIVEVDCRRFSLLKGPCTTDTFTLFCSQSSAIPPKTSMQMCTTRETVDSNGIALLWAQGFPRVKLTKGWYVTLGLNGPYGADSVWQAHIPDTLNIPGSIISGIHTNSCCSRDVDGFCNGCAEIAYVPSACPSIGTFNDSAFCTITGQVIGSDSLPLNGIELNCTNYGNVMTDRNGVYHLYNLDNCHAYAVRFTELNGTPISDTVVGPLTIIIGRTITVNIRLNYKFPTTVKSSEKTNVPLNKIRFLQTGAGQRIVLSVMETSAGKGTIELFSANGKCIRSLPVDFDKSGTYTINWDGCDDRHTPVGAGKYGCRVRINGETVCTGYIKK